MRWTGRLRRFLGLPWLAGIVALIGGVVYGWEAWRHAHTLDTVLDEGLYLLKGYLFASGAYRPFQEYGLWTNHMPVSFYIPGFVQVIFGPGLRTGRYFALALSLLFVLGVWLVARRLAGDGLAALAVWTLAMNPALIQSYSLATSQGLVACMLIWVLFLTLGEDRRRWQLVLGAALAAILALTRLNMTPLLLFLLIYIWAQHGERAGRWAVAAGLLLFLGGHAYYYPGILRMWVKWFPQQLTPFLDRWRYAGVAPWPRPPIPAEARLTSLFQGYYLHFVPLIGVLASWILWPRRWRRSERRMAIFLSISYGFLFVIHAWASLGGKHCVYCFSGYLFFFEALGLLLILLTARFWRRELSRGRNLTALGVVLTGLGALVWGYAYHFGSGAQTALDSLIKAVLEMPVPRFSGGRLAEGEIALWGLLLNKFRLLERYPYESAMQILDAWVRGIAAVLLMALLLVALFRLPGWLRARNVRWIPESAAGGALVLFLLAGWLLTPIGILGRSDSLYACGRDVIASYEEAGEHLRARIPPGSRVYWQGSDTQVALLYLDRPRFFPPQLNADYSLRLGEVDTLVRYGFWNDELASRWQREADVILIEERQYGGGLAEYVTSGLFEELTPAPEVGCRAGTSLHIYRRLP